MPEIIEIHGAVYDHLSKGHDRLFIDRNRLIAGVFDGAGGNELSADVVNELPTIIANNDSIRETSQELFMLRVLMAANNLPGALFRTSTVAIASVSEVGPNHHITYANLGDSSIYFYNHYENNFSRIAHTPTSFVKYPGGKLYIDTHEFLGNHIDDEKLKPLIGKLIVPRTTEWTLVGFSDGVQDDNGKGIDAANLKEIIQTVSPSEVPDTVLDSIIMYDDASIFTISHVTSEKPNLQ